MSLFSHRQGHTKYEQAIQIDRVDEETRNRLWSILTTYVWDKWQPSQKCNPEAKAVETLLNLLWFDFFRLSTDTRPPLFQKYSYQEDCYTFLRSFFFDCEWYKVYDFIEFIAQRVPKSTKDKIVITMNGVLSDDNVACRIVSGKFSPITNQEEVNSVTEAENLCLEEHVHPEVVQEHIKKAVQFLSDRQNPDYQNSIKESISAVESLVKVLVNKESATLEDGLKRINEVVELHPALKDAFRKLYGYTSDEDGIRHGGYRDRTVTSGDAKFVLVTCSAFINYVYEKFSERQASLRSPSQ